MNRTEDDVLMLQEAGFTAGYVRDLTAGDVVMIEHHARPTELTEMTVGEVRKEAGGLRTWIGVTPRGARLHCSYGGAYPCWRRFDHPLTGGDR